MLSPRKGQGIDVIIQPERGMLLPQDVSEEQRHLKTLNRPRPLMLLIEHPTRLSAEKVLKGILHVEESEVPEEARPAFKEIQKAFKRLARRKAFHLLTLNFSSLASPGYKRLARFAERHANEKLPETQYAYAKRFSVDQATVARTFKRFKITTSSRRKEGGVGARGPRTPETKKAFRWARQWKKKHRRKKFPGTTQDLADKFGTSRWFISHPPFKNLGIKTSGKPGVKTKKPKTSRKAF